MNVSEFTFGVGNNSGYDFAQRIVADSGKVFIGVDLIAESVFLVGQE